MITLPIEVLKNIVASEGLVESDKFEAVVEEASRKKQNALELLVSKGLISKDYAFTILSKHLGVQRVGFNNVSIDDKALNLISEDVARKRKAIVFGRDTSGIYLVAMEDPTDLQTLDFLSLRLGGQVRPFLATDEDLNKGFSLYGKELTQDFKEIIETSIRESLKSKARGGAGDEVVDVPIVSIVDTLLSYAISSRASDVHFEILDDIILVRFRIDGVLHEIIRVPKEIHPAVVARIKILAALRVDEHAKPQDGRFRHRLGDELVDIRVSIIPTFYGEKVELRLLTAAQKPLSLAELGMSEAMVKLVAEAIAKSYGMVLVTGPTGSGKTTTLYSILSILNRPEVNIVTVEDPIEYDMRYVNQVQVNPAAGITFVSGLRSILRQDPNIIMVGEVRDADTANISVQAALTGHLVLSSLHTNDAPTAVPRMVDMDVPPFLVAAVVNAVVAQRLTRKIHLDCIESYTPEEGVLKSIHEQLVALGVSDLRVPKSFYRGRGCAACGGTGYVGRVGIFEILNVNEVVRRFMVSKDFNLDGLRKIAREEGMITMFEDGLHKVELGATTVEELFRVIRE